MRVSDVSACNFESVSAGAMMIVGAIRRDAAARLALGPATLLMATEAWVKRAARVQARVYVCVKLSAGRRRSLGVIRWRRGRAVMSAATDETMFSWVKFVIVGLIALSVDCQTATRSLVFSIVSLLGRVADAAAALSSKMSFQTLILRRLWTESGTPVQSMWLLDLGTTDVMTRRLLH